MFFSKHVTYHLHVYFCWELAVVCIWGLSVVIGLLLLLLKVLEERRLGWLHGLLSP